MRINWFSWINLHIVYKHTTDGIKSMKIIQASKEELVNYENYCGA